MRGPLDSASGARPPQDSQSELLADTAGAVLSAPWAPQAVGGLAFLAAFANVVWHIEHGRWFECFWLCNVAAIAAALGLFFSSSLLSTVAFIWLVPGTIVWSIEVFVLRVEFAHTSYALHLVGVAAASFGVHRLGAHRSGFAGALGFLSGLLVLSRFLPEAANVNCAFSPRTGWSIFELLPIPYSLAVVVLGLTIAYATSKLALALATSSGQTRSRGRPR
jgi:hypothetical protein